MTLTQQYGFLHSAVGSIARDHSLTPCDVMVLLACQEAGGALRSDELEGILRIESAQIRRSSLVLRERHLVEATAADAKGGPPRRGVRLLLTLTSNGAFIAKRVQAEHDRLTVETFEESVAA